MITTIQKKYIYEMIKHYGPVSNGYPNEDLSRRKLYVRHFGFSIPTKKSVKELAKYIGNDMVLEIGGGLGLWAYLLSFRRCKCNFYRSIYFLQCI